ncbi:DUF6894 family protein [Microvirga arabica]|uniref:DUF6894 family protein n=1 Tax=Microvirga arabica TaxID=1128671 RepID=A0ABV6Y383_9HYPH
MPRFFFDTYDGQFLAHDDQGQELDDLEAAKAVAQEELPQMASDELPDGDHRVFMVSVRDEAGQVVMRVALTLSVEYPSRAP